MPPKELTQIVKQLIDSVPPEQLQQLAQLPYEELLDLFVGQLLKAGFGQDEAMEMATMIADRILNQDPVEQNPVMPGSDPSLQNAFMSRVLGG